MKYKVIMSGVPTRVKLGKIVQMISLMMSLPNRDFLVELMPSEDLMREVVVYFRSYSEAYLAQEMLDNFIYKEKTISSVFKATMHKDNRQPSPKSNICSPNRQPHEQEEEHQRDRSRSPHRPTASTELDMLLELMKKHKKVLDEQRKLFVDQKKLNILKVRSLHNKKRTKSVYTPIDPRQTSIKNACRLMMKTLTTFIYKHASFEEHRALIQHMRAIVMERIAMVVAAINHGLCTTRRVMNLYRFAYPPEEDEEFVKAALQDVKKFLSNTPTATLLAFPEGGDGNKVDGTEKAADDRNNGEGQATAKDTTSPGDSDVSESIGKKATEEGEMKLGGKNSSIKTAIRLIMKHMRIYMIIHSSPQIRELLDEYVYYTLKQRIDPLVADIPTCPRYRIISLYGSHYPRIKDEEFIKQLIKDINEGRVPEEIVIKAKQKKPFNKTAEEQLIIQKGAVKSDKHGQTGTKKDQDVTVKRRKEDTVESKKQISKSAMEVVSDVNNAKNVNDVVIDKIEKGKDASANTKNSCNEGIKAESTVGIGSDLKNAEKGNDNLQSSPNIIREHEIEKHNDHRNADRDSKMGYVVKETTQKCSDNTEVNKYNRGVKRENDEESNSIKHKSDHIAVIGSKNTNKK